MVRVFYQVGELIRSTGSYRLAHQSVQPRMYMLPQQPSTPSGHRPMWEGWFVSGVVEKGALELIFAAAPGIQSALELQSASSHTRAAVNKLPHTSCNQQLAWTVLASRAIAAATCVHLVLLYFLVTVKHFRSKIWLSEPSEVTLVFH
jgi:hypothetical protein